MKVTIPRHIEVINELEQENQRLLKRIKELEFQVHRLSDSGCKCEDCLKEGFKILRSMG